MSQHTPGPWVRTNLTIHTQSTAKRGALGIARVFEAGIETEAADNVNQATANARIIAAAPDLLAALKRLRIETQSFASPQTLRMVDSVILSAEQGW